MEYAFERFLTLAAATGYADAMAREGWSYVDITMAFGPPEGAPHDPPCWNYLLVMRKKV